MAARKPLFMAADGFSEEMAIADEMTLGGLTMGGNVVMASNKITGLGAGSASGDALAYGQSSANLGDLTLAANGDLNLSGGGEVLGLPTVPSGAGAAVSKAYADGLVSGLGWKNPVDVFRLVGNRTVAQLDALGANAGAAYVVTDSGTLTRGSVAVVAGDLVEDNGTIWVLIEAAVGGFVPAGIRAILSGTDTLVAPYTDGTDNDEIVQFTGSSNTGTITSDTVDKASVLVQDSAHIGYYDNLGYVYEGAVPGGAWIQFTGAGQINAGDGLVKDGNTLNVDLATDPGLQFTSAKLDLKLNGTTLQKGASGLSVKGLPLLFEINAVAVGSSVTAANLDDVLDGSSADSLHTHTGSSVSLNHSDLGSVTSDQHHNQSHVLDGGDHTVSGLTTGHVLQALSATTFGFGALPANDEAQRVENTIAVAEAVAVADPVYWNGVNDQIGKALANDNTKSRVMGLAKTAQATPGSSAEVVSHGIAVGVLSGATVGTPYYLQAAGGISSAVPGAGNRVILVGYAKNATDLWVQILDYGKKAA